MQHINSRNYVCLFIYFFIHIMVCKKDLKSSHFLLIISFSFIQVKQFNLFFFLIPGGFYDKFKFANERAKAVKKYGFPSYEAQHPLIITQLKNRKYSDEVLNFHAMGG